jgi:transposase
MERPGYPAEFRRGVLGLLAEGRSVASVAHDLDVSEQTVYNWRRQDRIDRGEAEGLTTAEKAELAVAKKRIAELETELAVPKRAVDLLQEEASPKAVRGGRSDRRRRTVRAGRLPDPRCVGVRVLRAAQPSPWRDPLNWSTRYESSVGVLPVHVAAYSAGVRSASEECGR